MPVQVPQIQQAPQQASQQVQQLQYTPQKQEQLQMQMKMLIKKPEDKTWFQKNGAILFAFIFLIFAFVCGVLCYFETRKFNSDNKNNNSLYLIYTYAIGASIFLLFAIILFIKRSMHSK
jgi:hypothetical protein